MRTDTSRFLKLALSAAIVSLAAGLASELRARNARAGKEQIDPPPGPLKEDGRRLIRRTIQYFLVPVWLAAGVADWWCHKRSRIEGTTGMKESLMHLLCNPPSGEIGRAHV